MGHSDEASALLAAVVDSIHPDMVEQAAQELDAAAGFLETAGSKYMAEFGPSLQQLATALHQQAGDLQRISGEIRDASTRLAGAQ